MRPLLFSAVTASGLPAAAEDEDPRVEMLREMPSPARSFAGNFLAAHVANASRDAAAAAVFYRPLLAANPENFALAEDALVAFLAAREMRHAVRASEKVLEGDPENGAAAAGARPSADIREGRYPEARVRLEQGRSRTMRADLTETLLSGLELCRQRMGDDALFTR